MVAIKGQQNLVAFAKIPADQLTHVFATSATSMPAHQCFACHADRPQNSAVQPFRCLLNNWTKVLVWMIIFIVATAEGDNLRNREQRQLATLAKAVVKQGAWEPSGGAHIPRILHYVYITEDGDLQTALAAPDSKLDSRCYKSCLYHHSHWTVMVWDLASVRQLVQLRYPEYKNFFNQLGSNILRSDVARYLTVYTYGGVYLDTDITCFKATDDLLGTVDTVLQGSVESEGLTNSAFASVSGASILAEVLEVAQERVASKANDTSSAKDPVQDVLYATGPHALKNAFDIVTGMNGAGNQRHGKRMAQPLTYHVWPVGTWFGPCWRNEECSSQLAKDIEGYDLAHDIAGTHHFKATWFE